VSIVTVTAAADPVVYRVNRGGVATGHQLGVGIEEERVREENTFQAKVNVSIAVVKALGAASGTIAFLNACSVVASAFAASSRSGGSSPKNATRIQSSAEAQRPCR